MCIFMSFQLLRLMWEISANFLLLRNLKKKKGRWPKMEDEGDCLILHFRKWDLQYYEILERASHKTIKQCSLNSHFIYIDNEILHIHILLYTYTQISTISIPIFSFLLLFFHFFFFLILWFEPRALHIQGKCSTIELHL